MTGHVVTDLHGIQSHLNALHAGESIESRIKIINGSNYLSDHLKFVHANFLKSWCVMGALYPYCGTIIDLGDGIHLALNKPVELIEGNELPGVRVDGTMGDLVIEGDYIRDGKYLERYSDKGSPLWPLVLRDIPIKGRLPFDNFRDETLAALKGFGKLWPLTGAH